MAFALIIPQIANTDKLVFQRRDANAPTDANLLGLFGGSIEADETPLDAAYREIQEETSLRLAKDDLRLVAETTMPTARGPSEVHVYTMQIDEEPFEVYEGAGYERHSKAAFLARHDTAKAAVHLLRQIDL